MLYLRILSFLLCIFSLCYYYDITLTIRDNKPQEYVIEEKARHGRSNDIIILHKGKRYSVGYPNAYEKVSSGDHVTLIYNDRLDYFYVPGSSLYKRYVYLSFSSFLILLIYPYARRLLTKRKR